MRFLIIILLVSTINLSSSTTTIFSYTGSSQSFSVPSGVTSLTVSITGASEGIGLFSGGFGSTVQTTVH
jgi:hypothetical protein